MAYKQWPPDTRDLITNTNSLSMKEEDYLPSKKSVKTSEELGITPQQWIDLAESLLISRDLVSLLPYGELAVIHKMKVDYLERYFGIKPEPPVPHNQEVIPENVSGVAE